MRKLYGEYRKLSRMQHLDFCQTSWQAISQSFTNHWHKNKNNQDLFYVASMSKWRMRHKRANLHSSAHTQRGIAEERFNMLARGWLAYPVTPAAHATTAEERLEKCHRHIGIVAERRLFSVTRYTERILPISRAGGTPLPMAGRLTQLAKIFPLIYTTALRR